jgi:hypothetical protein
MEWYLKNQFIRIINIMVIHFKDTQGNVVSKEILNGEERGFGNLQTEN